VSSSVSNLGLNLNPHKCKFMILSLANSSISVPFSVNGQALEQVTVYKYLGVDIDEKLSFSQHVDKVTIKAKQAIGAMCRTLRKWAPTHVFTKAITTIVLPVLFYAIEAWYPPGELLRKKLERVVKFAARLVTNNFCRTVLYSDLLKKLNWQPVYQLVAVRRLLLIKKYMDGTRHIPDCVFPLEERQSLRFSQRLSERRKTNSRTLQTFEEQKNSKEEKLACAHMRRLWNLVDEEWIHSRLPKFREVITSDSFIQMLCDRDEVHVVCV
jgi:hypothetical protein